MNTTTEKLKEFCQRNSRRSKLLCSSEHRKPKTLNRDSAFVLDRKTLESHVFQKEVYLILHVRLLTPKTFVEFKVQVTGKVNRMVVREGTIIYNGQTTTLQLDVNTHVALVLRYGAEEPAERACIKVTSSAFGDADMIEAKVFRDQKQVDSHLNSLARQSSTTIPSQILRVNQNQDNLFYKARKLSPRKSKSIKVRRQSFNKDENTAVNLIQSKPLVVPLLSQVNNMEFYLSNYCKRKQGVSGSSKNQSSLLAPKKNYKELYESLKNYTVKVDLSLPPKSREDIEKVYQQEKRRFDGVGQMLQTNQSQIIEEHISRDYFEDLLDCQESFGHAKQGNGMAPRVQDSESGLAVSQFM